MSFKDFFKAELNGRALTKRDASALLVFAFFVLFLMLVFFFPERHDHGPLSRRALCMSQLKQVGIASLSYSSDNDDYLPPYLTTDPTGSGQKQFVGALNAYNEREFSWFCPEVPKSMVGGNFTSVEGTGITSYVHSAEFERHILKHGSFGMSVINDPANLPYLRDPIRAIEENDGNLLIKSGHGPKFNLLFADGHARAVDMNRNGLSFPKQPRPQD